MDYRTGKEECKANCEEMEPPLGIEPKTQSLPRTGTFQCSGALFFRSYFLQGQSLVQPSFLQHLSEHLHSLHLQASLQQHFESTAPAVSANATAMATRILRMVVSYGRYGVYLCFSRLVCLLPVRPTGLATFRAISVIFAWDGDILRIKPSGEVSRPDATDASPAVFGYEDHRFFHIYALRIRSSPF